MHEKLHKYVGTGTWTNDGTAPTSTGGWKYGTGTLPYGDIGDLFNREGDIRSDEFKILKELEEHLQRQAVQKSLEQAIINKKKSYSNRLFKDVRQLARERIYSHQDEIPLGDLITYIQAMLRLDGKFDKPSEISEVLVDLIKSGLLEENRNGTISLSDQEEKLERSLEKRRKNEKSKQEANTEGPNIDH